GRSPSRCVRPSTTRVTTPASSSSFRWREIVGLDTPRPRLASPTVAAPPLSRCTISRRIGWASAVKVWLAITLTIVCDPADDGKENLDARSCDGNPRAMAGREQGAAGRREGAFAPRRRTCPAAAGAALGAGREGVHLRDERRDDDARRSLRWPLT